MRLVSWQLLCEELELECIDHALPSVPHVNWVYYVESDDASEFWSVRLVELNEFGIVLPYEPFSFAELLSNGDWFLNKELVSVRWYASIRAFPDC